MPTRRPSRSHAAGAADDPSLFDGGRAAQPLAARMRPRTLDEFVGQEHLLAAGRPLRKAIESGMVGSLLFWGPPGTGKTTLGHLIAATSHRAFVPFSAVSEGVPRLREIFAAARERIAAGGQQTVLFVDEIHRLNKAQQDSLLPAVENGTVTLVGATTENPSFEINGALLSRARVFVLKPLTGDDVAALVRRALADTERGLGALHLTIDDDALAVVAAEADGDARRALTVIEAAAAHVGAGGRITVEVAREAMQLRFARHDKSGDEHFNILSAYHKSLRGSDPQGALYWMARMIEGGEDPMTIFRRAIAMAAEDIGLADPEALKLAVAARDAYHMLGAPEGYLPLSEMTIYLATAPKSNGAKVALDAALEAARQTPAAGVPMHIRNAPTKLMKELGYHAGYKYAHDAPEAFIPQEYLPDELRDAQFYRPGAFGFEREVAKRMAWWDGLRARARGDGAVEGGDASPASDDAAVERPPER
ncbi:MAG TPA: replication-associated recombination protein A [Gemmatimonadaceae bacterium]|nr:replication-associated recombination protein A [Gemmatimonadaceae bacterium]